MAIRQLPKDLNINFVLFQNLSDDKIQDMLNQGSLFDTLSNEDIQQLPQINCNNFVSICLFVDYYQYIRMNTFLDNIRLEILRQNKNVTDNLKKLPKSMQIRIFEYKCMNKDRDGFYKHTENCCITDAKIYFDLCHDPKYKVQFNDPQSWPDITLLEMCEEIFYYPEKYMEKYYVCYKYFSNITTIETKRRGYARSSVFRVSNSPANFE